MYKQLLSILIMICCFYIMAAQEVLPKKSIVADSLGFTERISVKWKFKNMAEKKKAFIKSTYISVPLIVLGIYNNDDDGFINKYEIWEDRNEHIGNFKTQADNYLQFAPVAFVYTMNALGIKGKNNIWNQTALLIKSELIMIAIVHPLKKYSQVIRPDGSGYHAFPSGHTAQAFLSAEFFRKEYGRQYPLLAAGGYLLATGVGALRILNNRHWISDVMTGAGIGILSVNLAYLSHRYKWPWHKKKVQLVPTYNGYSAGIYLSYPLGK